MTLGDYIISIDKRITERVKKYGDGVIIEYLREEGKQNAKFKYIYVPFISSADQPLPLYNREIDETQAKTITGANIWY